jgi:isoamylase
MHSSRRGAPDERDMGQGAAGLDHQAAILAAVLAGRKQTLKSSWRFSTWSTTSRVISQIKLIADPKEANGGYVLGQFPPPWAQWNDHYRATVRDIWRRSVRQ